MFVYCIYFIFHCITFNLDEGKSGVNLQLIIVSVFKNSLIQGWKLHQNLTLPLSTKTCMFNIFLSLL